MFYSEDIIEQVRSENNIVDVIGDYVKLQKKGSSYFGLCPFHNEKSPCHHTSRCITVLDVEKGEMLYLFL